MVSFINSSVQSSRVEGCTYFLDPYHTGNGRDESNESRHESGQGVGVVVEELNTAEDGRVFCRWLRESTS